MSKADQRTRRVLQQYFDIPAGQEQRVLEQLEIETIEGGKWLLHQGEEGDSLYLLVRGRLQVLLESGPQGPLQEPRLLGRVTPGESVGELALLRGQRRAAGIRAVRDSQLIRIRHAAFDQLAQTFPSLVMKLAGQVASLVSSTPTVSSGLTRNLNTISLVPLDASDRCHDFCVRLTEALQQTGSCAIDQKILDEIPAAGGNLQDNSELLEALNRRVQHLEDEHPLLVFQCEPAASEWTRFAVRQSDLVILVADAAGHPKLRDWEEQLGVGDTDLARRQALLLLQGPAGQRIEGTSAWLERRKVDFHLQIRHDQGLDLARATRVIAGTAVGLVFGSGASRGFAHLGVYRALHEAGIPIDWLGGSSIGAIMSAPIAMGMSPEQIIDMVRKAFIGGKPFSDYTFPVTSLLAGRRMSQLIHSLAPYQIEDLHLPFFCVSSNLDDGSMNLHNHGSLAQALQGTVSMPGVFPPAVFQRHLVVDGSVLNSLPVDLMWRRPVGRVLAVDLSAHRRHEVDYQQTPSPWAILGGRFVPWMKRQRVPSLMTVMLKSTELATMQDVRAQSGRASMLFQPDVRRFSLTQVKAFDRIVEEGYRCANEQLQQPECPISDLIGLQQAG